MQLFKAFQHIAGCSLGTWSDLDSAIGCLDFIQAYDNHPGYNDIYPDALLKKEFRDLCVDHENIDLDWYSELVTDHCSDALPVSCAFSWDDGEFRITPFIDDDIPKFEELPEDEKEAEINPDNDDFIYVVNDHGNVTCYQWRDREWISIWDMV